MPNDVLMFEKSGMSIAMGNASAEVQAQANFVSTSNEQEGFANAVDKYNPEDRLLVQSLVISGRAAGDLVGRSVVDALDRSIELGVELRLGLLRGQAIEQGSGEAGDDVMIPPQPIVGSALANNLRTRRAPSPRRDA